MPSCFQLNIKKATTEAIATLEIHKYFYPFRREWGDQKHRQTIDREEMRSMLSMPRREGVSRRSRGS